MRIQNASPIRHRTRRLRSKLVKLLFGAILTIAALMSNTPKLRPKELERLDSSAPGRTLVMVSVMDHDIDVLRNFVHSLQKVYSGDIVILVTQSRSFSLGPVRKVRFKRLRFSSQTEAVTLRYSAYATECAGYDACLAADVAEVLFQDNPFVRTPQAELIFSEEFADERLKETLSSRVQSCWKGDLFNGTHDLKPICGGVVVGTYGGFRNLHRAVVSAFASLEKQSCEFDADDQVILNFVYYNNSLTARTLTQPHGFGIVNSFAMVPVNKTRGFLSTRGHVLNYDGTLAAAVYKFKSNAELKHLAKLSETATAGPTQTRMARSFISCPQAAASDWRMEHHVLEDERCAQVLKQLYTWSRNMGISFTIDNGLLLGWWRQCSCIPNSSDLDLTLAYDDFKEHISKFAEIGQITWIDRCKRYPRVVKIPQERFGMHIDFKIIYRSNWLGVDWFLEGDYHTLLATWDPREFAWSTLHDIPIRVPRSISEVKQHIWELYGDQWDSPVMWENVKPTATREMRMKIFASNNMIDVLNSSALSISSVGWSDDLLWEMVSAQGQCVYAANRTACINEHYPGTRGGAANAFSLSTPRTSVYSSGVLPYFWMFMNGRCQRHSGTRT